MIKELYIKNFKFFKDQHIEIKPITLIYGKNGTGKSTIMDAMRIMKNSLSIAGEPEVSHLNIELISEHIADDIKATYKFTSINSRYRYEITIGDQILAYTKNGSRIINVSDRHEIGSITWQNLRENGSPWNIPVKNFLYCNMLINRYRTLIPYETIKNDRVRNKINVYLENVIDRIIVYDPNNPLKLHNKEYDTLLHEECEGFKTVIHLISQFFIPPDRKLFVIENPEMYLHPDTIVKLIYAFIDIIKDNGKSLIMTTHSETVATTILRAIIKKLIKAEDVAFYQCEKIGKVIRREVDSNGRVEDGLTSFTEEEMKDWEHFFKIEEEV